jgi:hypothetical protein
MKEKQDSLHFFLWPAYYTDKKRKKRARLSGNKYPLGYQAKSNLLSLTGPCYLCKGYYFLCEAQNFDFPVAVFLHFLPAFVFAAHFAILIFLLFYFL